LISEETPPILDCNASRLRSFLIHVMILRISAQRPFSIREKWGNATSAVAFNLCRSRLRHIELFCMKPKANHSSEFGAIRQT
jgi:hypothetical protein